MIVATLIDGRKVEVLFGDVEAFNRYVWNVPNAFVQARLGIHDGRVSLVNAAHIVTVEEKP